MRARKDPSIHDDSAESAGVTRADSQPTRKHRVVREDHAEVLLAGEARFEVRRRLGSGGMGSVFEVLDKERGAVVALKTMHLASPQMLYAFKREFRSLADISHPRLVGLHELIAMDGRWYFTMDIVRGVRFDVYARQKGRGYDGPTVKSVATDERDPAPEEAPRDPAAPRAPTRANIAELRAALAQVVEGLDALHRAGKVHRDVKPSNVLVTRDGDVRIVDFGLVHDRGGRENLTHSAGTPRYMAPEQAAGRAATPASDFYALGIMLYATLVGRTPYDGSAYDVARLKQVQPAPPPSRAVDGVPVDLDELCVALMQIDPLRRPTAAAVLDVLRNDGQSPAAGPLPSVFVGRDAALAELDEAFADAANRQRPVCVLVSGESGMGKSELLRQLAWNKTFESDAMVLSSRCHQRETVPYNALDGLVDELAERSLVAPLDGVADIEGIQALTRTFPIMGLLIDGDELPMKAADPADRRWAFAALFELFEKSANERTVTLIIDDIQWADMDSAFGLLQLLHEAQARPFVLVASYREVDQRHGPVVDMLLDAARRPPGCEVRTLDLTPLSPADALACAARVLVNKQGGDELARAISAEADGHPFFVMELARHALESNDQRATTVSHVIDARLDALQSEARRVLDVVSLAGQGISQGAVLAAAALRDGGAEAIAGLRARSLVTARGLRDDDAIEIYHDRIRKAVVARIDAEHQRVLHDRLAHTLEARTEGTSELLAHHFERGGALAKAAIYAERAAAAAFEALAFDHAAALYTQAIACSGQNAEVALLARQARSLANAARGAEAAQVFERCAKRSVGIERLEFLRDAAEQYLVSGQLELGLATLRPLLEEVGLGYPKSEARAFAGVVARIVKLSITGTKLQPSSRTLSREEELKLDVCWSAQRGIKSYDTARGGSFMVQFLDLALGARDPRRVGHGLIIVGEAVAFDGKVKSARQATSYIDQAARIAADLDDPGLEGLTHTSRGMVAMFRGHWREARDHADTGVNLLERRATGYGHEHAIATMVSILCCDYMGDFEQLRLRVAAALRDADQRGNRYTRVQGLIYAALLRLAADDASGARARVAEAVNMWPSDRTLFQHWLALKTLVSVDLYEGDPERALARLDEAWPKLDGARLLSMTFLRIHALSLRTTIHLWLAERSGWKRSLYLRRVRQDIRRLEREHHDHAEAAAALARAGMAGVQGDNQHALVERARAARLFDSIDMGVHAAAARPGSAETLERAGIINPERWLRIHAAKLP